MTKENTKPNDDSTPAEVPGGHHPKDEGTSPVGMPDDNGHHHKDEGTPPAEVPGGHHPKDEGTPPAGMPDDNGHHHKDEGTPPAEVPGGHHSKDEGTPPAGMPDDNGHHHGQGGHDDCPTIEALVATLDLQSLPEFNVEEDVVILSKEIFTALESEEGDGFSIEEEFEVVMEEDSADSTEAVFVFSTDNNTLYYDANGADDGFGEDGGAIFEFAEIVGSADGLTVNDFFVIA